MNNRDWFCLALRLFGVWLLITAVEYFAPYLSYYLSGGSGFQNYPYWLYSVLWLFGRLTAALLLLFFAPAIATRFYPNADYSEKTVAEAAGPNTKANPLKVGIQLFAIYSLLLAMQSGAGVVQGILSGDVWGSSRFANIYDSREGYLESLLTVGFNLAFAAILLIWNEQIVTFVAKFRYVAERDAYEPPPLEE